MKTAAKNDHPILMSSPMVLAILNTKPGVWPPEPIDPAKPYKSLTRRVVTPQPTGHGLEWVETPEGFAAWVDHGLNLDERSDDGGAAMRLCPYGGVGDQLWVREKFFEECDPFTSKNYDPPRYQYKATYDFETNGEPIVDDGDGFPIWNKDGTLKSPWKPSFYMPRRASRLQLMNKSVSVERVMDITEDDARLEGVEPVIDGLGRIYSQDGFSIGYRLAYQELWNQINAKPKPVYEKGKIIHYVSYPFGDIRETREYRGKPWIIIGDPPVWRIEFMRLI